MQYLTIFFFFFSKCSNFHERCGMYWNEWRINFTIFPFFFRVLVIFVTMVIFFMGDEAPPKKRFDILSFFVGILSVDNLSVRHFVCSTFFMFDIMSVVILLVDIFSVDITSHNHSDKNDIVGVNPLNAELQAGLQGYWLRDRTYNYTNHGNLNTLRNFSCNCWREPIKCRVECMGISDWLATRVAANSCTECCVVWLLRLQVYWNICFGPS